MAKLVVWLFRDVVILGVVVWECGHLGMAKGKAKMSVSQMERELGQMGVEFDDDGQVSNVVILGSGYWL